MAHNLNNRLERLTTQRMAPLMARHDDIITRAADFIMAHYTPEELDEMAVYPIPDDLAMAFKANWDDLAALGVLGYR
jgi:hypothetical protein